jgi:hypothetical protein
MFAWAFKNGYLPKWADLVILDMLIASLVAEPKMLKDCKPILILNCPIYFARATNIDMINSSRKLEKLTSSKNFIVGLDAELLDI